MNDEILFLKWGTLKGFANIKSEKTKAALEKYFSYGVSDSVICQDDTEEQRNALYEVIDSVDGKIINDWSGETLSKEEARHYIFEYNLK